MRFGRRALDEFHGVLRMNGAIISVGDHKCTYIQRLTDENNGWRVSPNKWITWSTKTRTVQTPGSGRIRRRLYTTSPGISRGMLIRRDELRALLTQCLQRSVGNLPRHGWDNRLLSRSSPSVAMITDSPVLTLGTHDEKMEQNWDLVPFWTLLELKWSDNNI